MQLTFDWTEHLKMNVRSHLSHYRDRRCSLLEVGIFEGRSAKIFLDEVLTHPESTYTGIDDWWSHLTQENPPDRTNELQDARESLIWINQARDRAMANFAEFPDKCRIIEKSSPAALWQLHKEQAVFDIVYVDGSHLFGPCFLDSMLAWPLVKDVLLWDDAAPNWEVTVAIQHFLSFIPEQYEVLLYPSLYPENYQFAIKKLDVEHKFVEPMEFLMYAF